MPNRIIKESICTSDTIDRMSWFEQCLFTRLLTACDDYGRMDARPAILKSKLFPLKKRMPLKDIERALHKLADIGCVMLYECDGKPYLYLPKWEVHQQVRAKKSKYPAPDIACNQMISDDIICPHNYNSLVQCVKSPKRAQNALSAFASPTKVSSAEKNSTQFDFQRFARIAATAYPEGCQYTLEQCLEVFNRYFEVYENYMGHPHPPIRREQITRIMQEMPCIDMEDRGGSLELLDPEDYPLLIDQHFKTKYQNCDYNINHFFSGRIRELRLYEAE